MVMKDSVKFGISLLIPSYNNLEYLKACVESIQKYTMTRFEILVHVNEGSDGTLEWVKENNIKHTYSRENIGVSKAMNRLAKLANTDLLIFLNDDFYVLPGWEKAMLDYIENSDCTIQTWISGTMIEPYGNNEVSVTADYGRNPKQLNKKCLIEDLDELKKKMPNHRNSNNPPVLLHKLVWNSIGGYPDDVFAAGSDAHLAKMCYDFGCDFVQLGDSLVYHFMSKTVSRIKDPRGHKRLFEHKYKITIDEFFNKQLVRDKT